MSDPIKTAQIWEDGLRTDPTKKSFEWWYFDANLDDGSTIVLTVYTKEPANSSGPQIPKIDVIFTDPDGKKQEFTKIYPVSEFSASKEKCDIKMGPNSISGDLKDYKIHLDYSGINADIEFKRVAPSYSTRKEDDDKPEYFGWFPAIPYGTVKGTITIDGMTKEFTGNGYHDHNWGIIDIKDVCSYWYWGRGNADGYYMIFTVMILPKILGGKHASILYLAKDDKILIGDSNHLDLSKTNITPSTPKFGHLPSKLTFTYADESNNVEFTLSNPKLIVALDPLSDEVWWKKILTRLFSKPWYVRYNSDLELTVDMKGKKVIKKGNGLYEIMILH